MFDLRKKQDQVTRLLAGENLNIVRHNKVMACFDPISRTIYKPDFDSKMVGNDPDASDLIDIHEVGHALMTPSDHKITHLINVLEDKRIEKLLKRKFRGVAPIFSRGYKKLYELGFFGINNKSYDEINQLNLVDRINIDAKIGFIVPVEFKENEQDIIQMAEDLETFEDVVELAEIIKKFLKEEKQKQKQDKQSKSKKTAEKQEPESSEQESEESSEEEESFSQPSDEEQEEPESSHESTEKTEQEKEETPEPEQKDEEPETPLRNSETKKENDLGNQDESELEEPESETMRAFDEKMDGMVQTSIFVETLKFGKTTDSPETDIARLRSKMEERTLSFNVGHGLKPSFIQEYNDHAASIRRSVDVLYREFELKKNASERMRDVVSNTGKIDTNRLTRYQLTDQIFRQVTTRAVGKNHGFVFFLDISGSMNGNQIRNTVDQLLTITAFCDKASIPYLVFAFTEGGTQRQVRFGDNHINAEDGSLQLMLDSTQSKLKIEAARKVLYALSSFAHYRSVDMYLFNGTPSIETVLRSIHIVDNFFTKNQVEKRNVVFMTDGEPSDGNMFLNMLTNKKVFDKKSKIDVLDTVTKKLYTDVNRFKSLSVALSIMCSRVNAECTYMHLIDSAKDMLSLMYVEIWDEAIKDKSLDPHSRAGLDAKKYANFPQRWTGTVKDIYLASQTKGYEPALKIFRDELRKNGFIRKSFHSFENAFFIRCCAITTQNVDDLELNKQSSAAQLGRSLVKAIKGDSGNRILMSALADKFNYS